MLNCQSPIKATAAAGSPSVCVVEQTLAPPEPDTFALVQRLEIAEHLYAQRVACSSIKFAKNAHQLFEIVHILKQYILV